MRWGAGEVIGMRKFDNPRRETSSYRDFPSGVAAVSSLLFAFVTGMKRAAIGRLTRRRSIARVLRIKASGWTVDPGDMFCVRGEVVGKEKAFPMPNAVRVPSMKNTCVRQDHGPYYL